MHPPRSSLCSPLSSSSPSCRRSPRLLGVSPLLSSSTPASFAHATLLADAVLCRLRQRLPPLSPNASLFCPSPCSPPCLPTFSFLRILSPLVTLYHAPPAL
ncbi:hypothetical protein MSAN_02025200 [Mycena sanguinolenta]|uniref:Uncharacterized protein n=1 Tax=Mycena sanguinolenta TaxID=230812 RepID=A0A8H6XL70_9AGAR|nr:hypothetical protein MSAN_02025200 [Mycena sanguinolenta]